MVPKRKFSMASVGPNATDERAARAVALRRCRAQMDYGADISTLDGTRRALWYPNDPGPRRAKPTLLILCFRAMKEGNP
jgi:hypothetical protein